MRDLIYRILDSAPVITVSLIVAWYDLWIGVFIDRPKRTIYILPVPCFGVKVTWRWEVV